MADLKSMDDLNNNNLFQSYNNSPLINSGTWDTEFLEWTGIELDPYNSHNVPISANYYSIKDLVFFSIHILITNPISWGKLKQAKNQNENIDEFWTPWRIKLPFKKRDDWDLGSLSSNIPSDINSYSADFISGRYIGKNISNIDLNNKDLDEKTATLMLGLLSFKEYLYLYALDDKNNNNSYPLKNITSEWPVNFTNNNFDESIKNSSRLRLFISGTYIKETL